MPHEISAADYEELVLHARGDVVVDFFSTECPPCEALAPKYEQVSTLYGDRAKFYKIFRQGNRELALSLNVISSPTVLFYRDGQEIAPRLIGAIKKSELKRTFVERYGYPDLSANASRREETHDVVIIGGGPAGLTAALYASRAKFDTLVIDQGNPGGQVNLTHLVANYPGLEGEINGALLMHKMTEQAKANGARILQSAEILRVDLKEHVIDVDDDRRIRARTVIVATGARPRELGLPGEKQLSGKGISYCATCDGRFFEGKDVYVIGGGNSAVEEALFLAEFVKSITVIHQFDTLQANQTAADAALAHPKFSFLWSHEPRAFLGQERFEKLEVEDLKTKERKILSHAAGVFLFVGYVPQIALVEGQLPKDEWGALLCDERTMATAIPGVFVAGDVRSKLYRQITTAVSDGTIAALSAQKVLRS